MIKYLLFFIISSVIVFLTTVYIRLGGYKKPEIEVGKTQTLYLVSKSHTGAYHKINDVIVEVEAWAAKNNLPCPRTFGEYLDNPKEKDEDRLRSEGGCILSAPLDGTQVPQDFHYRVRTPTKSILASFDGAPSIGPFRVYPAVEDYMRDHQLKPDGPVIEIYEIHSDRDAVTRYIFGFLPQ